MRKQRKPRGHRKDARAYIRPLAINGIPRLPRKSDGNQGTSDTQKKWRPGDTGGTPGRTRYPTPTTQKRRNSRDTGEIPARTSDPLAVHVIPRLLRESSGNPKGRQGVYPTPWQCTLSHACYAKAAETKGHRRDARAYIRPLAMYVIPRLSRESSGNPKQHQGIYPTPWQCTLSHACHAKIAKEPEIQRDARRTYIRPLGTVHYSTPATQKRRRPRDTGGTPGRTSDPLAAYVVPCLSLKGSRNQRTFRPLGSTRYPTPATQKRRRPTG